MLIRDDCIEILRNLAIYDTHIYSNISSRNNAYRVSRLCIEKLSSAGIINEKLSPSSYLLWTDKRTLIISLSFLLDNFYI